MALLCAQFGLCPLLACFLSAWSSDLGFIDFMAWITHPWNLLCGLFPVGITFCSETLAIALKTYKKVCSSIQTRIFVCCIWLKSHPGWVTVKFKEIYCCWRDHPTVFEFIAVQVFILKWLSPLLALVAHCATECCKVLLVGSGGSPQTEDLEPAAAVSSTLLLCWAKKELIKWNHSGLALFSALLPPK